MDTLDNKLEALTFALEQSPNDPQLLLQRGKAYHRAGRFDQAYNDFVAVLTADPENAEARDNPKSPQKIYPLHSDDT